jgi:dephospho-CoA kinase
MSYSIGLIGGIASGKSTVLKMFRELGIECFSADEIAREIVQINQPAYLAIVEHLGKDYLLPNQELDRAKIRKKMLDDKDFKLWLEQLTHPIIRARLLEAKNHALSSYCVLEIPLLKNKVDYQLDQVLLIQTTSKRQKEFLKVRGLTDDEITNILQAQIPEHIQLQLADNIIDNSQSMDELKKQIQTLHQNYLLMNS